MSSPIPKTPITIANLQKVLGLDAKTVATITAHVQNEQSSTPCCRLSSFLNCILAICRCSKADDACAALEAKTIRLLVDTHFLSHSEAVRNARSLSIFLFDHLRALDDPHRSLIDEQRGHPITSMNSVDLIDALNRAPYGNGKTLVNPQREQAETMIFRTREKLEETLAQYDALNPPPAISLKLQSQLKICRQRLSETSHFTEFPNCSFKIASKEFPGQTINPKELYEIWCKLRNAHYFMQNLYRDHLPSTRDTLTRV